VVIQYHTIGDIIQELGIRIKIFFISKSSHYVLLMGAFEKILQHIALKKNTGNISKQLYKLFNWA